MAHSIRFARFAKVGPPALILCSGTVGPGDRLLGEAAVLMPGPNDKHVFRLLTWDRAFSHDPLIVLSLAQMQATLELGLMIPHRNVLAVVEFEPISDEELVYWRVLRQFESLATIGDQISAMDLADAIRPYKTVAAVNPVQ